MTVLNPTSQTSSDIGEDRSRIISVDSSTQLRNTQQAMHELQPSSTTYVNDEPNDLLTRQRALSLPNSTELTHQPETQNLNAIHKENDLYPRQTFSVGDSNLPTRIGRNRRAQSVSDERVQTTLTVVEDPVDPNLENENDISNEGDRSEDVLLKRRKDSLKNLKHFSRLNATPANGKINILKILIYLQL